MTDTVKTVNKTKLSNGEIRYYEDTQARNDITDIKTRFNDLSVNFDSKQDKLIAGDNITITAENVISASGVDDYNQLNNKPTLDGVTLEGDMHFSDFELKTSDLINDEGFLNKDSVVAGEGISISETPNGILVENTQTSAEWGKISGNIFNQFDLQSEFESKQDKLTAGSYIDIEKDSEGKTIISTSGGNYNNLDNKPSIDGHIIEGDMSASEVINLGSIQVSSFINDVPYQTPADIKAHNESAAAHADIRQQINVEVGNRETADSNLQEQIDALASSSDVIDILGSYAELQRYDTSRVKENDIIKVIQDETRENAVTYYRWLFDRDSEGNPLFDSEGNHEGHWSFIGEQGPYYTSAQVDDKFVPQSRNINGHDLRQDVTLHYSDLGSIPDNAILSDAKVTFKKNATSHLSGEYDSEGNPIWIIDYNSGETMGIISMNQSGDGVINYNIPTNVNQLEGFSDLAQASNYYNKDLTDDLLDEKQDVLVAGAGITIENNSEGKPVISSTSTGVTWGNITGDIGDQADLQSALAGKQTLITSSNKLDSTLISGLSNVATNGSYNDLVDVPDITGGTGISVTKDSQGDFVVSNTMSALEWGNLTGNISNQIDLKDALDDIQDEIDSKQDQLVAGDGIDITLNSSGKPVISNTRISAVWGNIEGTLTDQVDLTNALNGKVDKETGKGLSTNDFTTSYKNKLDGIENNAEVNVIETVKRNGVDLAVTNKAVDILVPTTVAELSDSSDYVTDLELTTALNDKVDKVTGKQLSTNDFTDILKDKLDGIEAHAEVNVLESISVNNDTISISGKNANLTIEGSSPVNVDTQNGVVTVSHAASGVMTGSKGDSSDQTPGFGDTFKVTSGTVDASGHMTTFEDHTVTIPSSIANTIADGLMSSADKIKLNGIDTNAQVNVIESISKNGTTLTITNKNVDITVPIKTSDLTNDGNGATPTDPFATQSSVSTVNTKVTNLETRVDNIVASGGEPNTINHIQKNGSELPIVNKTVDIFVPTATSDLTNDSGFITTSDVTPLIPTKTSDLINDGNGVSNFATVAQVNAKQDPISAGTNIDIINNTVSVTGLSTVATSGSYSDLSSTPSINGIVLSGNKTTSQLGITEGTVVRIVRWE